MKLRVGAGEARAAQRDPTLLAAAYQRQRLPLFSRREPEDTEEAAAGRYGSPLPASYYVSGGYSLPFGFQAAPPDRRSLEDANSI